MQRITFLEIDSFLSYIGKFYLRCYMIKKNEFSLDVNIFTKNISIGFMD